MKETEKILQSAGESVEYARQYFQQQVELIRLEAAERTAMITSAFITAIVIATFALFGLLLLSIATGIWLGNLWQSYPKAFLVIAGFYFIVGFIVYFFRKSLVVNPVLNFTLNAFFKENEN